MINQLWIYIHAEKIGGKVPPELGLETTTPGTLVGRSDHLSYSGGPVITVTYRLYIHQTPGIYLFLAFL